MELSDELIGNRFRFARSNAQLLKSWVFIIALFTISIITPVKLNALDSDIVITEIAAYEKSDHEWIEIYNKSTAPVALDGWKFFEDNINHTLASFRGDLIIEAGEYAIIADIAANTAGDYPQFTGTLIDSSWQTLNEEGETIALKGKDGIIIESFTYLAAPTHSLERLRENLSDYSSINWVEHPSGNSIGLASEKTSSPKQDNAPPSQNQPPIYIPVPIRQWQAQWGDVVINELVSDPSDRETEWVEFYNNSGRDVELRGWTLEDGSGVQMPLLGALSSFGENKFRVFEPLPFPLNNGGDILILKNERGDKIDEVRYGSWNDGTQSGNAPAAPDPSSLARIMDGFTSSNNTHDFRNTTTITKGSSNVITQTEIIQNTSPHALLITEIFPNPTDDEMNGEFIELYNPTSSVIHLDGMEIANGRGHRYVLENRVIGPGEYLALYRKETRIALQNYGGDIIRLYQKNAGRHFLSVQYKEDASEGVSYSRTQNGIFVWTRSVTPQKENTIPTQNNPPEIALYAAKNARVGEKILFDASDTRDAEGEKLSFLWIFGDGHETAGISAFHVYENPGTYHVTLRVKDEAHEPQANQTITISGQEPVAILPPQSIQQTEEKYIIVLNELLPNPKGSERDEFIELANLGSHDAEIDGWFLVSEHLKKEVLLPQMRIASHSVFAVRRPPLFQLRNQGDRVKLLDNQKNPVDDIDYEDAPSGKSLARTSSGNWVWSNTPSPGFHNTVDHLEKEESEEETNDRSYSSQNANGSRAQQTPTIIRGIIATPLGLFGKTTVYLAPSGIKVFSAKNGFPSIRVGDSVEVRGLLKQTSDGPRISLAKNGFLRVIKHEKLPLPQSIDGEEFSMVQNGKFVRIEGIVQEIRWPKVTLAIDEEEIIVNVKRFSGIRKSFFTHDAIMAVSGIFQKQNGGYHIIPRSQEDIVQKENGVNPPEEEIIPQHSEKEKRPLFYLLGALGVSAIIFLWIIIREYRKQKQKFTILVDKK